LTDRVGDARGTTRLYCLLAPRCLPNFTGNNLPVPVSSNTSVISGYPYIAYPVIPGASRNPEISVIALGPRFRRGDELAG